MKFLKVLLVVAIVIGVAALAAGTGVVLYSLLGELAIPLTGCVLLLVACGLLVTAIYNAI